MFSWNELMRQLDVVKNAETLQGQCVQMRKAKVSMHDTWHSFGQLMDVPGVINGPNSGTYNQMSEIFDQADKKINTFLKENCTPPAQ